MDKREIVGYTILVIIINVILMIVKILTGVFGNSYALIADGIESASDVFISLITWIGFSASLRPPDQKHPYGHGKIESLAGMFSGGALLAAAGIIAYQSVGQILSPQSPPEWFTLPVLLGVVAAKEILARRISVVSAETGSIALDGDSWHHRSDALTSAAVAIGIAIALFGGPQFAAADDWGALIACGIIALNGARILSRSFHENIDGRIDESLEQDIRTTAENVEEILAIEKCGVRKSGMFYFAEVHVQVDPDCTVSKGHEIGHDFKDLIIAGEPKVKDVVVHIEPFNASG